MFKFVIYASTICIINIYINFLKKKNNDVNTTNTSTEYVLQIPAAFKRVAMLLFGFGMFMFVFFYLFKISGNKTVSAGHLYLALVLATMGLLANIWADQWNVQVNGTDIIIHTLFNDAKVLGRNDLEWYCGCSKEHFMRALSLISQKDIEEMIQEGKGAHVKCQYCEKEYDFTQEDLKEVLDRHVNMEHRKDINC